MLSLKSNKADLQEKEKEKENKDHEFDFELNFLINNADMQVRFDCFMS